MTPDKGVKPILVSTAIPPEKKQGFKHIKVWQLYKKVGILTVLKRGVKFDLFFAKHDLSVICLKEGKRKFIYLIIILKKKVLFNPLSICIARL